MQTLDARRPMPQRRQGRSFTILGNAQLIHAGQHVAQLHDEGGIDAYAGIRITTLAVVPGHGIGQHAVPIIPGEVFAQQRTRAAWIPRPHMSHMDGAHRTQQRILLGAVQQPRQRLARPRTHDGDQPERDGRQRRDRSRLGGRPQLANHLIAYHIGDLTPGYRHHRSGFAEPSQPGHQGITGQRALAHARSTNHQQRLAGFPLKQCFNRLHGTSIPVAGPVVRQTVPPSYVNNRKPNHMFRFYISFILD